MIKTLLFLSALAQIPASSCEEIYISPRHQEIVEDAFYRFSEGTSGNVPGYFALVLVIDGNRCVHLRPKPRTLGPSPTFCYDMEDRLVGIHGLEQ